jgi:hypothetical protein
MKFFPSLKNREIERNHSNYATDDYNRLEISMLTVAAVVAETDKR